MKTGRFYRSDLMFNNGNGTARDRYVFWLMTMILIYSALLSAGCITIPSGGEEHDLSIDEIVPDQNPDISGEEQPLTPIEISEPVPFPSPVPTSHVSSLPDRLPADHFVPGRTSVYYEPSPDIRPDPLYTIYTESAIPLNTLIREREITVEKGPFSIWFSVTPKGSPLISWARVTVRDPFGKILFEEGFNRRFSTASAKEFTVYSSGFFILGIEGEYGTIDIAVRTSDQAAAPVTPAVTPDQEIPPEILMQMGMI